MDKYIRISNKNFLWSNNCYGLYKVRIVVQLKQEVNTTTIT
jgi:hypothetical protein